MIRSPSSLSGGRCFRFKQSKEILAASFRKQAGSDDRMRLVLSALTRPLTVIVLVIAIALCSILAMERMRIDIFPNVGEKAIYVAQPYGGMDPAQMEGYLTYRYEYHFLYITGIEHVESKSIQGNALIKLQFYPGTDMSQAMAETVAYVNAARAFMPTGTLPPFITRFDAGSVPAVIFVTAFDRYALQAFEQHALDYLLKPFSDERFSIVLDRTRARLREHSFASMAEGLSDLLSAMAPARRQLVVRDGGRTFVIPHDDIVWIEAEDYCARIHTRTRTILVRDSLRALADSLEPNGFVRVHRSAIVNVPHVRQIEPLTSGDQKVTLSDGTGVKVSRTYRASVLAAIATR